MRHVCALAALSLAAGCAKEASNDRGEGVVVLAAAGASPTAVVRPPLVAGKLRIVANDRSKTQTRVYAVTPGAGRIALKSTGEGEDLPPAELTLTVGARGQIVEPPRSSKTTFNSSAEYAEHQRDTDPNLQAARNELRWLFAPLPAEPIGIGARWRFVQDHDSMVGPMHQTIWYELLERDATALKLRVQVDATSNLGNDVHANGTVVLSLAGKLPHGSFQFANDVASGTLELTPVD